MIKPDEPGYSALRGDPGAHIVTFHGGRQLGDELDAMFKNAILDRFHEDTSGISQWDIKMPMFMKDTAHEAIKRNGFRIKGD